MMTRKHFEILADNVGMIAGSITQLDLFADELAKYNPRFNRDKFLDRAYKAWEKTHGIPEFNDEIPY